MSEVDKVKWTTKIGNFFRKLWNGSFGKLNDIQVKRINAAFGSFLMAVLMGLGAVIVYWCIGLHPIYVAFLVGSWEAFAIFIGVLIITVWGTTKTLPADEQAIAKVVLALVSEQISEAMSNMDENVAVAIQNTLNSISNGYAKTTEVAADIKENVEELADAIAEAEAEVEAPIVIEAETAENLAPDAVAVNDLPVLEEAIEELDKGEDAEITPE